MRNFGARRATGWKGPFWRRARRFLRNCSRSDVDPGDADAPEPPAAAGDAPRARAGLPMMRGATGDTSFSLGGSCCCTAAEAALANVSRSALPCRRSCPKVTLFGLSGELFVGCCWAAGGATGTGANVASAVGGDGRGEGDGDGRVSVGRAGSVSGATPSDRGVLPPLAAPAPAVGVDATGSPAGERGVRALPLPLSGPRCDCDRDTAAALSGGAGDAGGLVDVGGDSQVRGMGGPVAES